MVKRIKQWLKITKNLRSSVIIGLLTLFITYVSLHGIEKILTTHFIKRDGTTYDTSRAIQYTPLTRVRYLYTHKQISDMMQRKYSNLLVKYVREHSLVSKSTSQRIVKACLNTKRPELILAIIKKESTFNPYTLGSKTKYGHASGLGQIMWTIWKKELQQELGIYAHRELFEVETNIKATDYIITKYLRQCDGHIMKALGKYYGKHDSAYIRPIVNTWFELMTLRVKAKEATRLEIARHINYR